MIISKVSVMHQSFIEAAERMGTSRMPYSAFGRVPLMGDPDMGFKIFQPVILSGLLGIAYDLQDHHIAAVRKNEGLLLPQGGVEISV